MWKIGRLRAPALALLLGGVLGGCGGGGGGGGAQKIDVHASGRVVLASIGGGTLDVYRVGDYASPLLTVPTSTGATLPEIGRFAFDLAAVPEDALFLLVARGGQAFDTNENGILDSASTPNRGAVHALASAAELQTGEVHLSAASELVYQRLRYSLSALYDDGFVLRTASSWAGSLLRASISGVPDVDNDDVLAFDPLLHQSALFRPYAQITPFVTTLLANGPLTETALDLLDVDLGSLEFASAVGGLDVVGDLAYVTTNDAGLAIVDISDPTAPTPLGSIDTPDSATGVQVVGSLAYVNDGSSLQIVNVANPAAPTPRGSLALGGEINEVEVAGHVAYVAATTLGAPLLHIVDVSNPGSPSVLKEQVTAGTSLAVRVLGTHAYVLEPSQIETFDVSNPAAPVSLGTRATQEAQRIEIADGHLFVAGRFLEVFDLGTPSSPVRVGSIGLPTPAAFGLVVEGGQALVGASGEGIVVVDVSTPAAPALVALVPVEGFAHGLARAGGLVATTSPTATGVLSLLAFRAPEPSGAVARVPLSTPIAVEAAGGRVYVTHGFPTERLSVFDASDPLSLSAVGNVDLAMPGANDLVVAGTRAFVSAVSLQVYDVGNPFSPSLLGQTPPDTSGRIAVGSNVVYESHDPGIFVVDVSDPTSPTPLGSIVRPGFASGIAFDGSVLAHAESQGGVSFFTTATPTAPSLAGVFPPVAGRLNINVALRAPTAFVTEQPALGGPGGGLRLLDYANPSAPASVRFVPLPGTAGSVVLSGTTAYVRTDAGLHAVNVALPSLATRIGTIPVAAFVEDVAVDGAFLYLTAGGVNGGLLVVRGVQVKVP